MMSNAYNDGRRRSFRSDSDWPQLRVLAILAQRGALKFFAVLNVLGEDFMVFWREHDELSNCFSENGSKFQIIPIRSLLFSFRTA